MITREALLIRGKAKEVYETSDPHVLWVHNLNQATALNGKQKEEISDKGHYTNAISALLFGYINQKGIPNHFIEQIDECDQLIQALTMFKLEIVTRHYAAGSFAKKFDIEPMSRLVPTVQELYYKSDPLDDPMLNSSQAMALGLVTDTELVRMNDLALQTNAYLRVLFDRVGITLVDSKLEFGKNKQGEIILADELSPDNMRLIDQATGASLDKDVFRKGTGDLRVGYATILERLQAELGE
ncbi:phosphoribosylaminoimidazolesuccinocarboxamide synthase [Weissella tructae]|jgi:phosphoribosylaminoimidazole-succinocarboxamide synthase|uniref:Phosphoribosylaminoimidazole-succinocarboxamide synthase n=2 Tax=Weissella TaxID=46255 RepID=A0A088GFR8_9LACO|nr:MULTISPECIES: phosphoribosylaminoimidazolesuccinocarboxamide synthase [Weissella]AIG65623.1 Phosphoribosylaminoimidazole-succinocarboxamide synthase [Weissella tructae]AIM62938.2 Phosphoribosylaminoimidazole-succinocarboxamide synthase [Weissella ceti]AIM64336.1 Phosphoribosylaminoimidazole-succinocarboxamide synthase [Weissella ceti]ELA06923.1 phosphoribosylaminoimidazole-succinocarboxamide synthase [Weissella ceti NC36]QVV90746.1 phosphoribosylaminoimidazolesuccinocarboxamide synthase [We